MTLRERLERVWTVAYSPLRAWWLARSVYALLGADLWFEMIQHGGRYGLGDFNVAHFAWLDVLMPMPTPALYVGTLIFAGGLSLWLALGMAPRWLRTLLAATYTLSWMISIHDSYQHHYFLSYVLFWLAAVPDVDAREALAPAEVSGWGVPMTCVTCAILYLFTGISKSEPEWRAGTALRALTRSMPPGSREPGKFDGARDALLQLGLDEPTIWRALALATIALQWTVALAYCAAIARDLRPSRLRAALCFLGLFGALSFHGIAEIFHIFEIGLFSYYMMFLACALLGPLALLRAPVRAVAWLEAQLAQYLFEPAEHDGARVRRAFLQTLVTCAVLVAWSFTFPLPGAVGATLALGCVFGSAAYLARRDGSHALLRYPLRISALTLCTWLALTHTSIPFDYYRRTAGELSRMGQLEQALETYRMAERYAPEGQSRRAKIHELERELQRSAPTRRF